MKNYPNIENVRSINFDKLNMLVSERIGVLKMYVHNIDKAVEGPEIHEAICRDLIIPCIGLLAQFLEAVKIGEQAGNRDD